MRAIQQLRAFLLRLHSHLFADVNDILGVRLIQLALLQFGRGDGTIPCVVERGIISVMGLVENVICRAGPLKMVVVLIYSCQCDCHTERISALALEPLSSAIHLDGTTQFAVFGRPRREIGV
jgi:hypothetical protein